MTERAGDPLLPWGLLQALRCTRNKQYFRAEGYSGIPPPFSCQTPRTVVALYLAHQDLQVTTTWLHDDRPLVARYCEDATVTQAAAVSVLTTLSALDIDVIMPTRGQQCGSRPLSVSIQCNRFQVAECLIVLGADVNAPITDDRRMTPMTLAAKHDRSGQTTERLLQYGARMDVPDYRGMTPFSIAAQSRNLAAMKIMHRYGYDVNFADRRGKTPLMVACSHITECDPIVDACLLDMKTATGQAVVDIDEKYRDGRTALSRAVTKLRHEDKMDVVQLLLQRGAQVDSIDRQGWTPFIRAVRWGDVDVINLLHQHGCNVNIRDRMTPLMHACQSGNRAVICGVLKLASPEGQRAVDLSARDNLGRTALDLLMLPINDC